MRKTAVTILSLICLMPAWAQNNAEQLLQKTVSKLEKDGGIFMAMDVKTRFEESTDIIDMELSIKDGCFFVREDDNSMWFDGNTLWRGNDFGSGIEEIYITEPTKDEKARYDIIDLLGKHQGFSVTGNGTDTFTLTASTPERSVEGIQKITVKVDPKTVQVKSLEIEFDQQLGSISASVLITQYKPGQKFDKKTFTCPVKDYKDAEIIDLR